MNDFDFEKFIQEVKETAAKEHVTANELDILVSKTRELSDKREKQVKELRHLIEELEAKLNKG